MTSVGANWTCPYCGKAQVVSEQRSNFSFERIYVNGWKFGNPGLSINAIVCANDDCKELTLKVQLRTYIMNSAGGTKINNTIKFFNLLPSSFAKPQPNYIPIALRSDYEEACAIRDLSPKASATLTRRCLQGMIRDFCGISKNRLVDEIKELRSLVEDGKAPLGVQHDTVDAIDHVRSIGNIGAHMEADINLIVDVDPAEAQTLIDLTELLFEEWYVARDQRARKLEKLGLIAADKKIIKQQKLLPSPSETDGAA